MLIPNGDAMKTFSFPITLLMATIALLLSYPKASAATFNVTIGPNGDLVFSPSSVTIHPGDTVRWTWGSNFHRHHVRYSRGTQRNLGFRNSQPGSYFQSYVQSYRHFSVLLHSAWWMLQHGGLGHRGQSFANADTYTASKFDTDADTQTHAHADTTPGCYSNFTTAGGCDALGSLTTGAGNTALGWRSLFLNTTGSFNTGVGAGALILNNADSNTAVGAAALLLNTTGTQNTAVGTDALVFNDSGSAPTLPPVTLRS